MAWLRQVNAGAALGGLRQIENFAAVALNVDWLPPRVNETQPAALFIKNVLRSQPTRRLLVRAQKADWGLSPPTRLGMRVMEK